LSAVFNSSNESRISSTGVSKDMKISLDNGSQIETVVLLGKNVTGSKSYVDLGLDVEDYYRIKDSEKNDR
jgi:hypothetical protein